MKSTLVFLGGNLLIFHCLYVGWATAADNLLEENVTVSNSSDSPNYSWPSVNDLGLSDLKISDDELGLYSLVIAIGIF